MYEYIICDRRSSKRSILHILIPTLQNFQIVDVITLILLECLNQAS
jgi:hypothetical protein